MLTERIREKLQILATAARYDVSCSSSGSKRAAEKGGLGNTTGMGICHSYTQDGRCVSLLKILLTNHCIFDCAYCISRRSNDIKRAAFTVQEVVDLTIGFYRRNYIEGLFLSSGIFKDVDTTMERLVQIGEKLRHEHKFGGYIHLKAIPGASPELLERAGRVADRLSVNIEIPSEMSLKHVAPEKNYKEVMEPMAYLRDRISEGKQEQAASAKTQLYLTAGGVGSTSASAKTAFTTTGQTTQLVVGATPETDTEVLRLADGLYRENKLKRVYYSGYIPIATDARISEGPHHAPLAPRAPPLPGRLAHAPVRVRPRRDPRPGPPQPRRASRPEARLGAAPPGGLPDRRQPRRQARPAARAGPRPQVRPAHRGRAPLGLLARRRPQASRRGLESCAVLRDRAWSRHTSLELAAGGVAAAVDCAHGAEGAAGADVSFLMARFGGGRFDALCAQPPPKHATRKEGLQKV